MILVVRNGTVVTTEAEIEADITIGDGKFAAIAPRGELDAEAADEYDATGQHVLPGVIDGHVQFREPGLEYKEDWRTGSTAAACGGVTTVIEMPNTNPKTDTVEGVEIKKRLAEEKSYGCLVQSS